MGSQVLIVPAVAEPSARAVPASDRLESVDLLRGLVMVIMALDHVRDFLSDRLFMNPTDLTTTTPAIFLTRWVTHYCAPTFIFLAGTGAFLSRPRWRSRSELAGFLLSRGLWLVFLELTVIRVSWMFSFDPIHHGGGVFWAIGWSMVVLAGLVYLPTALVTLIGLAMIASHNLLDGLSADQVGLPGWLWVVLHRPGDAPVVEPFTFGTSYCLVPWCGVMAAGYGFGAILRLAPGVRQRCLFGLGLALILGFVLLRAANVYGDPRPKIEPPRSLPVVAASSVGLAGCPLGQGPLLAVATLQPEGTPPGLLWTCLAFLNCTKYPPSLLYLLMTLGPAILFLAIFDRPLGPLARPIVTFGRVPLFFYLLHIPLIHGAAVLCDWVRFGWSPQATDGPWAIKPGMVPDTYGLNLPTVYLTWIGVILLLYLPCRWYAGFKRRHRNVWLSYL